MRAKVLKAFRHASTGKVWLKGEYFVGDEGAAEKLAREGFLEVEGVEPAEQAAPEPDLGSLTVKELAAMCAERGVETPQKARKADLVALLESAG